MPKIDQVRRENKLQTVIEIRCLVIKFHIQITRVAWFGYNWANKRKHLR